MEIHALPSRGTGISAGTMRLQDKAHGDPRMAEGSMSMRSCAAGTVREACRFAVNDGNGQPRQEAVCPGNREVGRNARYHVDRHGRGFGHAHGTPEVVLSAERRSSFGLVRNGPSNSLVRKTHDHRDPSADTGRR